MNELRKLAIILTIVLLSVSAGVFAQSKAACYTTWDDNYLYTAFQVDDPDVAGTNTKPFSTPWDDDCVEIFLETDNKHAAGSSRNAYHMAVSAAGGAAFSQGDDDGVWKPKRIYTFKYASNVDGSINNSEDLDNGYVVEMAIPWGELGVNTPQPGTMMSFNVVIRQKGEVNKFVSLSPKVTSEKDIHDASKWVDIVFTAPTFGAATLSLDKIVSSRYITRMPLMDGQIRLKEYNANTSFTIPLSSEPTSKPKSQFQKMLLTYYYYRYQADPRKSAPTTGVRADDGSLLLTDQPVRGAGPWFSSDRVQWHKDELTDIKRAGIDIILPVYRGDSESRAEYSAKGLDVMVEAMRELKSLKKPYPLVGIFLDTDCITAACSGKPSDLRDKTSKEMLYGMIRDFFARIPEEFRAQVQLADERAGKPSYIVQLQSARPFSDLDPSFVSYINERFVHDFGANIMWLGGRDFKEKAPALDGYCLYGAGLEFTYDDTAKIRIAAIGPGYDDSAISGRNTPIRSRDGGDAYRTDWSKALVKKPNWIILDGWNHFAEGTELCGTRQYGFTYVDATALQAMKFRGPRDYDAKYLRHNLPSIIKPDTITEADVMIQNDGTTPWLASNGFSLSYRWYQAGKPVGDSGIKRPLQRDILPGHADEISIGIIPIKDDGSKLAPGDYEIRFEMVRMSDGKWFSQLGDDGLSVPVSIGEPKEDAARFLTLDGPVMLKTGANYTYKIRVRNDGPSTWKAGTTAVFAKLFQFKSDATAQEVAIAPVRTMLVKDIPPGQVADADLVVNLKDAAAKPVPTSKQAGQAEYHLQFGVEDGTKTAASSPTTGFGSLCDRIIDVADADYGADIVASDVGDTIDAGKTIDVKLVVRNIGPDPWVPGTQSFGYHWYYLDGTEAVWDGLRTPLKLAVKPGEPTIIPVKLTAPAYDGRYILAWDFADKDRWASTAEISRGGDICTAEVTVTNGKLQYLDLAKTFDTVASSPDRNRQSGNFDGQGKSFPAELLPPDIGAGKPNDIYPSGYGRADAGGKIQERRISFRYGPKAAGDKNSVTCAGQTIEAPKGKYSALHILGASVSGDQTAEFGLGYLSSIEPAKVTMSSWASNPTHGETIALSTAQRHSATGDERGATCNLFRYSIPVDPTRQLSSIVLPKNDKVRVVAITLEKP